MRNVRRSLRSRVLAVMSLACLVPAASAQVGIPEGLSEVDWLNLRATFAKDRHAAVANDTGFSAYNRSQAWNLSFDGRGFLVEPTAKDWIWGLELTSYGFAGSEREIEDAATIGAEGQRITNTWDDTLDEWYINDGRGLEHGFTIHERPTSGGVSEGSPLTLTLHIRGELEAQVNPNKRGVRFTTLSGSTALNYSGLKAFDSNGCDLPAWFECGPEGLTYFVDERGASYPLTIDPVAQLGYFKSFTTGMGDRFGHSIAVSGDRVAIGAFREDSDATGINGDKFNNDATDAGAVYVYVRSGANWFQQGYIKASNTEAGDNFGTSLAYCGNTLVVGAGGEDSDATGVNGNQSNNNIGNSGAVYVFIRTGSNWTQEAYIKASNTGTSERFGSSLAMSGDTLVVGAAEERSNATGVNGDQTDNSLLRAGAAYVFVRNGTMWSQQAYLKASNTRQNNEFGYAVAVLDDTIAVGARLEESASVGLNGDQSQQGLNFKEGVGAVYVFNRVGTTWSQGDYVKPSNVGLRYRFGTSIDLDGDTMVVGAPGEAGSATGVNPFPTFTEDRSGAVYVFVRAGSSWIQQAYVKASNTDFDDNFGHDVAISGNRMLISATNEDSDATGINGDQNNDNERHSGAAYLFTRNGVVWSQLAYIKASNTGGTPFAQAPGDQFGHAIALSEDLIAIGASHEDSNSGGFGGDQSNNDSPDSGAAYTFEINTPSMMGDVTSLSLSAGGQQTLSLDAGAIRANWFYWIFGSGTGTSPGINLTGGLNLPLNFDGYFNLTLTRPGLGAFGNFLSQFDGSGQAQAVFTVPPGVDPTLAGITLNHAYLTSGVLGGAEFASNPVPVLLTL